jgi:hypothetical protein
VVRCLVVTVFAALAVPVAWAPPAAAADPVVVTGSAPATAHGPGTVPFSYTIQVAADLDSAMITSHQDAFLPADAASLSFDGTPVPAAAITVAGGNFTADLGVVAAGQHIVTFNALVQATPSVVTSSTVDVSYLIGAAPPAVAHSAAVTVDINEPDIAVVAVSDIAPLPQFPFPTGVPTQIDVGVLNQGFGAPPTTLRITLPDGLDVASPICCGDTGDPIPCPPSTTHVLTCALGPVRKILVTLDLVASPSAAAGTTAAITISATPDEGVDQDPTHNDLTLPIKFTGIARLSTTLTPATGTTTVGHSRVITVTVHNAGPQPAEFTLAGLFLEDTAHFKFTAFDGPTTGAPTSEARTLARARLPQRSRTLAPSPRTSAAVAPDQVIWTIGTLAPGQTATAHLTVLATSAGSTQLGAFATSTASSPVDCDPQACRTITLTAVNAIPTASPPPTTPATAGSVNTELPATGAVPWPLIWVGIALLLTGLALIRLADLSARPTPSRRSQ